MLKEGHLYKNPSIRTYKVSNLWYAAISPVSPKGVCLISKAALEILDYFKTGKSIESCQAALGEKHSKSAINLSINELKANALLQEKPTVYHNHNAHKGLSVWLHVTNQCNLRCKYCYLKKDNTKMSERTATKVIDSVFRTAKAHNIKRLKIKLSGGEALLNLKTVKYLVKYARRKAQNKPLDLDFVILSNGISIKRSTLDWIKKNKIRMMISLDGVGKWNDQQRVFENGEGTFKHIDKTVTKLRKLGIQFNLSVTLSMSNIKGLPVLIKYILRRKLFFALSFYRENSCSTKYSELEIEDRTFIKYLKKTFAILSQNLPERALGNVLLDRVNLLSPHNYTCDACRRYLVFDQNGNLSKCQMDMNSYVSLAKTKDPLRALIQSKGGFQNLDVNKKENCRDCFWRYYCCGGCPLLATSSDQAPPFCRIYKAMLPELVLLEGKRLLKYRA